GAAADARHAARTVRFQDVGDDTDRIRELLGRRDDRLETAFRQGAVTDFAPPRSSNGLAFADAERREVVIEHEFLAVFVGQAVHALLVAGRPQRGGNQGLRLAAGKNGRAVRTRQDADFARYVAQLF